MAAAYVPYESGDCWRAGTGGIEGSAIVHVAPRNLSFGELSSRHDAGCAVHEISATRDVNLEWVQEKGGGMSCVLHTRRVCICKCRFCYTLSLGDVERCGGDVPWVAAEFMAPSSRCVLTAFLSHHQRVFELCGDGETYHGCSFGHSGVVF
jgi:hypothetical protein